MHASIAQDSVQLNCPKFKGVIYWHSKVIHALLLHIDGAYIIKADYLQLRLIIISILSCVKPSPQNLLPKHENYSSFQETTRLCMHTRPTIAKVKAA